MIRASSGLICEMFVPTRGIRGLNLENFGHECHEFSRMKRDFTMCAASIQLSEDRIQSTETVSLASFMNRGKVRLRIASKQLDDVRL